MSFLIRCVHVTAVSFIFGGALLLFLALGRRNRHLAALLDLMRTYEWASWAAIGLMVMTGVGNLGHFGEGLPNPDSGWGRKLTLKLVLVLFFLALSTIRTFSFALASLESPGFEARRRAWSNLRGLYGATALFVATIVGTAISLAHF